MDVLWESTQVFFAVYHPNDKDVKEQPWLVMLTVSVSMNLILQICIIAILLLSCIASRACTDNVSTDY